MRPKETTYKLEDATSEEDYQELARDIRQQIPESVRMSDREKFYDIRRGIGVQIRKELDDDALKIFMDIVYTRICTFLWKPDYVSKTTETWAGKTVGTYSGSRNFGSITQLIHKP